jgi:hypothetical protein
MVEALYDRCTTGALTTGQTPETAELRLEHEVKIPTRVEIASRAFRHRESSRNPGLGPRSESCCPIPESLARRLAK